VTLVEGTRLNNRYRILTVLGLGGMGAVYQAIDENLGILVAVKENLYLSDEFTRQFQREASVLAGLRHPNLPRVSDYFSIPNQGQYIIMDYVGGEDLRQRIEREGVLPERDVILIGADICDALTYLHSRIPPIIHRDIKPGNIKITADRDVILVDFGLVKVVQGKQPTITGARAMTPGYSPPEQYGTARTDARTDIYSLGATLYASLTGVIPEDSFERVTSKVNLTPLTYIKPGINHRLAKVVEKSLETEAEKRFQSAKEFKDALLRAGELTEHFQEKIRISPPPSAPSQENNHPILQEPNLKNSGAVGSIELPQGRLPIPTKFRRYVPIGLLLVLISALFLIAFFPKAFLQQVTSLLYGQSTLDPKVVESNSIASTNAEILSPQITSTSQPGTESPNGVTALPTPSATPFGGGPSMIAFTSNRTGTYQVWLMKTDGSQQHQLTSLPDGACQPDWSADGNQIVFISPCAGKFDSYPGSSLYIINTDGTGIHPLPVKSAPQGDFDPAWSPDNHRIAFTSLRTDNKPHIFIFDMLDSSLIDISNSPYGDKHPAWGPGGLQLVFVRLFPNSQIWISSDNGKSQFRFSPSGPVTNQMPVWSPQGQEILYSQTTVDGTVPYLVGLGYEDRTNGQEYRIPAKGQSDSAPVFHVSISPDSGWMVFESWPDGTNHDIYLSSINGANRKRLTTDRSMDFEPVWQPTRTQF
jgi:eukaryotic-like serine/threonine-protein kinase